MKATLLNSFITGVFLVSIIELIRRYKKKSPQKTLKGKINSVIDSIRDTCLDVKNTDTDFVFKCKFCGQVLQPKPGSDERSVRGSWQCPNGHKL